ncbi:MAG: 1-phosphofructokinase [Clostridia bacterium]|nr:1-phosphofructokinase [Clostridia bacterium]
MVYTITLNPALDYVMRVGRLRYDDINRSQSETIYYGGKGINVSVILKRLDLPSRALGFTAGFTGAELKRLLEADGIDCDFTDVARGATRINVKIKADTELDVNANGPEVSADEVEGLMSKLDEIKEGDYLVLAGSIPKNVPSDIYERILERIDGRGINIVVDATGELLLRVLKYRPFLIKPNHHELGDLFGVKTETEEQIGIYARKLREIGARNVLVSRSKDGAILYDENGGVHYIGTVPGQVVNSVGSGDSMVAGFIAGYIQSGSYASALRLGAACGNATAFSEGLADAGLIREMYNKLK